MSMCSGSGSGCGGSSSSSSSGPASFSGGAVCSSSSYSINRSGWLYSRSSGRSTSVSDLFERLLVIGVLSVGLLIGFLIDSDHSAVPPQPTQSPQPTNALVHPR